MSTEYWKILEKRLKEFWKPGQEVICIRVFKKEDSQCELCDYQPITWNFVLINIQTTNALRVGSRCVKNFRKVIDGLDSEAKFLLFDKYHKSIDDDIKTQSNATNIINIDETVLVIDKLLSENKHLSYKALKPILQFSSEMKSDYGDKLFHKALDIFIENKYFLIESSNLDESEYSNPQKWKEHLLEEALHEDEIYLNEYISDFEGNALLDDCAPEGLGVDEIDWDSNDIEER